MKRFFLLLFGFYLGSMSLVSAQSWTVTEMSPMPKAISNNAVVAKTVNGIPYVYSFAGIDSSKLYSGIGLDAFRYNTITDTWDSIPPLPDPAGGKIAASASVIDSLIYIIGGYHVLANDDEISSNKIHRYNPETNTYLTDGADIPVPIDDQVQGVWRDSLIYVITGWSQNRNVINVQIYNTATDSWSVGTPVPTQDRYRSFGSTGVIVGNTIFYFGGASSNGVRNFPVQNTLRIGIIDSNDATQIAWSDTILDTNLVGYRMACSLIQGNIHWIGGSNRTYNYDGISYANGSGVQPNNRNLYLDPKTLKWDTDTSSTTPFPMDLRSAGEVNATTLYLAGGMEMNQKVSNKMLKLEFMKNSFVLPERNNELSFTVYPNPAENHFYISFEGQSAKDVELINSKAQIIGVFKSVQSGTYLPTNEATKGIYIIKIGGSSQRLIIN